MRVVQRREGPPSDTDGGGIDRLPPHNLEAERALLGSLLLDGEVLPRVLGRVLPTDFYALKHATLYEVMLGLYERGQPLDPLAVVREAMARGVLDQVGGPYLLEISHEVASPGSAPVYAELVVEAARRRAVIAAAQEAQQRLYEGEDEGEALAALGAVLEAQRGRQGAQALRPWPAVTEIQEDQDATAWLWKGYLARGSVAILAGHPKAGKSTLLWGLIRALEQGRPFCGAPCTQGTAVLLTEEPRSTLREKRDRFGVARATYQCKADAFPRKPFGVVMDQAIAEAKRAGATLLVVDTWAFWTALAADEEKDAGAVSAALEHAHRAAAAGLAVLLVHHLKKADGEEGTGLRGSSALAAGVEAILELRRYDAKRGARNTMRSLHVLSRHEGAPQEQVIDLQGDQYVCVGDAAQARDRRIAEQIVEYVRRHPWARLEQVKSGVPGSASAKVAVVEDMILNGLLQRIGAGGSKHDPYRLALPGVSRPTGGPEDVL